MPMQYSTGVGKVQQYHTTDQPIAESTEFLPRSIEECFNPINEEEIFQQKLKSLIKLWTLEESQKQDIKFKNLSKIEKLVEKIAIENGALSVESKNDSDGYFERFFVVKIPKKTDKTERRLMFNNIVDQLISICEEKNLLELFMKTSIFLR